MRAHMLQIVFVVVLYNLLYLLRHRFPFKFVYKSPRIKYSIPTLGNHRGEFSRILLLHVNYIINFIT